MNILPLEIMPYKEQIKNQELLTKLRIIRFVLVNNYLQAEVAAKFSMHRNTVTNIINNFKSKINEDIQSELLIKNLSWPEIVARLKPLRNK